MASRGYREVHRKEFRFGVFSDIQYADCDDGFNFNKTKQRFYRHSLVHLNSALEAWKTYSDEPCVDAVLNLGDSLDGLCRRLGLTEAALQTLHTYFVKVNVPIYNVVGNHDLYNISRDDLFHSFLFRDILDRLPKEAFNQKLLFHDFSPLEGFRVVILDSLDVSCLGLDENDSRFLSANALLRSKNCNKNLNDNHGLLEEQFVLYNGALGSQQMKWLEGVLSRSEVASEHVIIVSKFLASYTRNYMETF